MPLYMSQISYTNEALKALVKHPQDRAAVFREQVEKLGGRVIAFYHCMGKYDVVTIYEVPDEATASALILTVKGPGHLKEVETTELHTVEVAMEGMRKANKQSYQGPDRWGDAFSSLADVPPARPSE
jgi:uncharacterized protein with GYD domain